jgi:flavin reductase (DIM6/NTAB) family NADH-FMN oxidoreductase RutF
MTAISDLKALRNAFGHFVTGVAVVTAQGPDRRRVGMTINSFSSLSLEPPLVLWSIAKTSGSLPAFTTASHFAVHILAATQQALSDRFATPSTSKFENIECSEGLGKVPLLAGCAAVFECALHQCIEGGDHLVLIGKVERFNTNPDALPLVFHRGRYVIPEPGGLFSLEPPLSVTNR